MSDSTPELTALTAEPVADEAAAEDASPEVTAPPARHAGRPRAPRRRAVLTAVLAAVLVAAAAVLAIYSQRQSTLSATAALRGSALAAARQEAVNFTSYDYRHLSADFAQVTRNATGSFRKEFQTESGSLAQLIGQSHAVAVGHALDAALVSCTSTRATAIVALDDSVTNTAAPKGVVRHYRLQIVLNRVKGRWLVSNVQPVA